MGQRSNNAASTDVQIKLRREGCASSMEQTLNPKDALSRDAQIMLKNEAYAGDMVQTATLLKYLPHTHSIQNLTKLLQL
jgi:hypothetical protein